MASFPVPGWRNGIRTALKMRRAKAHEGSIPSPGTTPSSDGFHRPDTIDLHRVGCSLVRFVGSKLHRPVGDQATVPGSQMALVG